MPCLLVQDGALVKTVRFANPHYVGDPINAIRIYNEKEVDELIVLDIGATPGHQGPPFQLLSEITNECFMPMCYGGGIRTVEEIRKIFALGVEKVALNSMAVEDPSFVERASMEFGRQSIVVSVDAKKSGSTYTVFTQGGRRSTEEEVISYARRMESLGAGELLLTSMDRDGTMEGFDVELVQRVTANVRIPVVACGGAGSLEDIKNVVHQGKASAAAIGSMAVYHGRNRAVLIGFPRRADLVRLLEGVSA
jgi:cyclase